MKKVLMVSLIAILSTGCARTMVQPQLTQNVDPYSGEKTFVYGDLVTVSCNDMDTASVDDVVRFGSYEKGFTMTLMHSSHTWSFIEADLGLDLLIDGEATKLTGVGQQRDVRQGGSVTEQIVYNIDKTTIQKMQTAQKVRFRALGSGGVLERCLAPEELIQLEAVTAII